MSVRLSRRELSELTGLSYRQLDYWHRTGAFTGRLPADEGYVYDERDLVTARFLSRVSKAFGGNVPVHLVARITDACARHVFPALTVDLGEQVMLRIGP